MNIMNKSFLRLFAVASSIFILASCEFQMDLELYITDLLTVALKEPEKEIRSPLELRLEIGSKDSCEEKKEKIVSIMSKYFGELKDTVCYDSGMKSYLSMKGTIPISHSEAKLTENSSLLGIIPMIETDRLNVLLFIDPTRFQQLRSDFKSEYMTSIESKDIALGILIQNDSEGPVEVETRSAYVEGQPYPFAKRTMLQRREKEKVKLSTIYVEFLLQEGKDQVLSIYGMNAKPQKEETKKEKGQPSEDSPKKGL